jgi:putative nucleotidyltransferase with HDIG domain
MISSEDFNHLLDRFKAYLTSLSIPDSFTREHIDLKVKHTYHVISNSMLIGHGIGLSEPDVQLARIIALVHDIGRFQQFISFGTFDDSLSVNHAELGISVLADLKFLEGIADALVQNIILQSVLNHNIPRVDPGLGERTLLFSRLLRDADKLDIWEILTVRNVVNTILEHSEPEFYDVPMDIYESFINQQVVPAEAALTINDYRLLRLSWIYDMNFPVTYKLIASRDYATKILTRIPPSEKKKAVEKIIHDFIAQHAR